MAVLGIVFGVCGLIGLVWTVVIAIQSGDTWWGILGLLCGIVAIIYAVQHLDKCKVPLALMALAVVGNIITTVAAGV